MEPVGGVPGKSYSQMLLPLSVQLNVSTKKGLFSHVAVENVGVDVSERESPELVYTAAVVLGRGGRRVFGQTAGWC